MTYTKPQLVGYAAVAVIQASAKTSGNFEVPNSGPKTNAAYEADE